MNATGLVAVRRRVLGALVLGGVLGSLLAGGGVGSAAAAAGVAARAPGADGSFSDTKTLTRDFLEADATTTQVDTRDVTVTVDQTAGLRARQVVNVAWTGAHPTGSRATDPRDPVSAKAQEYPVVVLQCRGVDDPALPLDQQLRPETCWTTFFDQRYTSAAQVQAVWAHDEYATEADRQPQNQSPDWPADTCGAAVPGQDQHLLPFVAADGTTYQVCSPTTQAPEMGADGALPPNDLAGFTALDGTGSTQFEIRTQAENASLGCSTSVPCALVVIPIMGISCLDENAACRQTGGTVPGSSQPNAGDVQAAVSTAYWWSASNWRNKFVVPLTFAPSPDLCDVFDHRAPVDLFGSELLSQASLQWAPAYCLRADRFKFRHDTMGDDPAVKTMLKGDGAAAFVAAPHDTRSTAVAYAPVAVTGFAVAYAIDRPDNQGEVEHLRLTPRLLAKLLTQSYTATRDGRGHPGLATNPLGLNTDPEFIELNPGLSQTSSEAWATMLAISGSSDVMTALTSYIAADPDAMAFVNGTADPWGMVVNPSYQGIALPVGEWPLKDTWLRTYDLVSFQCQAENFAASAYFNQVAAPVSFMSGSALAVLDAWPNVQTRCDTTTTPGVFKTGRVVREPFGARGMLGLVTLGDAARYDLRTAELRTSGTGTGATFVGAGDASMTVAVATATQSVAGAPYTIDAAALRTHPDAYPGTMIVHAVAKLSGLAPATAGTVADFIRVATTEGQVRGSGIGQLPNGFLPLTADGATAALFASAQTSGDAIRAQAGPLAAATTTAPAATTGAAPVTSTTATISAAGTSAVRASNPVAAAVITKPGELAPTAALVTASAPRPLTIAPHLSGFRRAGLPTVLGVGGLGLVGAPVLRRLSTRRPRP